jgi:polyphosphate kinase
VLALVEIKARFDEQPTSRGRASSRRPACTSCTASSGSRRTASSRSSSVEEAAAAHYSHIGTGNYNPKTSRIYEDSAAHRDDQVGKDLTGSSTSCRATRSRRSSSGCSCAPPPAQGLLERIATSAQRARRQAARIRIKVNSMVDEEIIDAPLHGQKAGVPIDIWVRGICSLGRAWRGSARHSGAQHARPLPRALAHLLVRERRDPQVYIGSADLMHRNLDRRSRRSSVWCGPSI